MPVTQRKERRVRYLLSRLIPVPMRSTHVSTIKRADIVVEHVGNHFDSGTHSDLVSARWWQWRGRTFAQRTVSVCIPQ